VRGNPDGVAGGLDITTGAITAIWVGGCSYYVAAGHYYSLESGSNVLNAKDCE
jgi:hypothetical protein